MSDRPPSIQLLWNLVWLVAAAAGAIWLFATVLATWWWVFVVVLLTAVAAAIAWRAFRPTDHW